MTKTLKKFAKRSEDCTMHEGSNDMKASFDEFVGFLHAATMNRIEFAEQQSLKLADELKLQYLRIESARKKQNAFLDHLAHTVTEMHSEAEKSKKEYHESCVGVRVAQEKFDQSPTNEKLNKILHQAILDSNNCRNKYTLTLEAASQAENKYRTTDIPAVLADMAEYVDIVCKSTKRSLKKVLDVENWILSAGEVKSGESLIQDSPTDYGNSEAVPETMMERYITKFEAPESLWNDKVRTCQLF